jgi:putative oxidoreductase
MPFPEVQMSAVSGSEFDTIMLLARIVVGPTIFVHGYNKMFRGGKIKGTAGWFDSMGMKPNGTIHAWIAALTEMGTGVLILFGLLTPLAAAGVVGLMVVAGWTVHRGNFLITKNGVEYTLLLGAFAAMIGALGPGDWSLDHVVGLHDVFTESWRGLAISLGLGLVAGIGTIVLCYRPPKPADS